MEGDGTRIRCGVLQAKNTYRNPLILHGTLWQVSQSMQACFWGMLEKCYAEGYKRLGCQSAEQALLRRHQTGAALAGEIRSRRPHREINRELTSSLGDE